MTIRISIHGVSREDYEKAIAPYHFSPKIEVTLHPDKSTRFPCIVLTYCSEREDYWKAYYEQMKEPAICRQRADNLRSLLFRSCEGQDELLSEETSTGQHIRQCESCKSTMIAYSTDAVIFAQLRERIHLDCFL